MNNTKSLLLSIVMISLIWLGIAYSCTSSPSLKEVREAREMMRSDMTLVLRQKAKVVDFDDDRKTKIGSAILSIAVAPESWTTEQISNYEQLLLSLGWKNSFHTEDRLYFCKKGASALILSVNKGETRSGYIYMKYPRDPLARCPA